MKLVIMQRKERLEDRKIQKGLDTENERNNEDGAGLAATTSRGEGWTRSA